VLLLPLPLVVDPLPEDGAVGTNVPVADERQELATWLALDEVEAFEFTVPFPLKLHAWGLRLFASKYSLIIKESLVAVIDVSMRERETRRNGLTGIARGCFTILPRLTIGRNCTTASSSRTEERTSRVEKWPNDPSRIGDLRIELTTKASFQALARRVAWSGRQCG
jgi:hypothetical protein